MSSRVGILLVVFLFIIAVSLFTYLYDRKEPGYKPGISEINDRAVHQAQNLYKQKKALGVDFSTSPCLSNDLLPGWVVDLVHSPRQQIDNLPENECQAFIEGRATHFVELDLEGNVVRVK